MFLLINLWLPHIPNCFCYPSSSVVLEYVKTRMVMGIGNNVTSLFSVPVPEFLAAKQPNL
jgi:hypothetical protein